MKEITEKLKINYKQKRGKGIFRLVEFEDHNSHIVYIPSLNLSAYGDTSAEAKKMMGDIVLEDFFETLFSENESTVYDHLKKLGWKKSGIYPKELSHDVHVDKDGILKNFNLPTETKITEKLVEI